MTDHTQLRKLAEAVKPGWFTCHTGHYAGQLVRGRIGELVTREGEDEHPDFAFIAKANPKAVIELLDEIERLKQIFRVNMLRAFPEKSHDEITAEIEKSLEKGKS